MLDDAKDPSVHSEQVMAHEAPPAQEPPATANPESQPETRQEAKAVAQDLVGALQDQIEKLAAENAGLKDQALRALAETQNAARRHRQELDNFRKFATESLVRDIVPVLDNFDRTLDAINKGASLEAVVDGVRAVERQLQRVLEQHNVKRVHPQGEQFDPMLHEAVVTHETDEHPDDTVLDVLESGYLIHDRVIRPSRVRVSKRS